MDFQKLLRASDDPALGCKECRIKYVIVEDGAISHIAQLVADREKVVLVADENTYAAAGKATEEALGARIFRRKIFQGSTLLVPDERATEALMPLCDGADLIVGVGSGVIQDLCKYVSMMSSVPYFIVATAPSMDGYASSGAAMIMGGMKVTYPAGLPLAIIADTQVLKDAPMDMIKAGYGDIVGKYSALCDWRLSECVNGEGVNEYVFSLVSEIVEKTVPLAKKLLDRDPCSIKTLSEALIAVGIAMSLTGNSRPASGSEHHLSHFFEITGIVHGEEYLPHGIDVLYSTAITAKLRERIRSKPFPCAAFSMPDGIYRENMHRLFGTTTAEGCIELQGKLGSYERDLMPIYLEKENKIKEILALCPPADEIEELIKGIKLDMGAFLSLYGEKKINDAVLFAKDLKDRYTVLWLNYAIFGGEV